MDLATWLWQRASLAALSCLLGTAARELLQEFNACDELWSLLYGSRAYDLLSALKELQRLVVLPFAGQGAGLCEYRIGLPIGTLC